MISDRTRTELDQHDRGDGTAEPPTQCRQLRTPYTASCHYASTYAALIATHEPAAYNG